MTPASSANWASLGDIVTYLGQIGTWFWTIFQNLVDTITGNDALFWVILFGIVATAIGGAIKVVKKFGLRGRRS